MRGGSEVYGSWNTIWARRRNRPAGLGVEGLVLEADLARRRVLQQQHRAAERRLAAARLADQPERLSLVDRERHAVDGANQPGASRRPPGTDPEVLVQVAHLEQRGGRHRNATCCAELAADQRWQAARCPAEMSKRSGSTVRHTSITSGHRGAQGAPGWMRRVGQLAGDRLQHGVGREVGPAAPTRAVPAARVARSVDHLVDRPELAHLPRHTSPGRGRRTRRRGRCRG